jgi:formate dehydrogenase subunit gamma
VRALGDHAQLTLKHWRKEKELANKEKLPSSGSNAAKSSAMGSAMHALPRFYFPLIIAIILAEAVILVLALLDILPRDTLKIYPTALYASYIGASDLTNIAVTVTRWFFFLLTTCVMVPVTLIIILEIMRRVIISIKGEPQGPEDKFLWLDKILNKMEKPPKNPNLNKDRIQGQFITRFDVHQRIQHYALFISFIVLAVTGVLRGFPDWPTFSWFTRILGGPEALRLVHDVAAFVMIVDGIYHLLYIAHGILVKKKYPTAMLPSLKDLKDVIHTSLWIFGLRKHEPVYDRFQYGQKIDYWAIFWGMPVMVITGIVMMFPSFFSQWIGGRWFAVAATAHRDEAVLAISFIFIVHMYYGHLASPAFPVNTTMFTGKMLKAKYKEWFGKEYAALTGDKSEKK